MEQCYTCSNVYDKLFKIEMGDKAYYFDCFECAIHALAPICKNCDCKIIGHGVEKNEAFYCCAHCAKTCGTSDLKDRG